MLLLRSELFYQHLLDSSLPALLILPHSVTKIPMCYVANIFLSSEKTFPQTLLWEWLNILAPLWQLTSCGSYCLHSHKVNCHRILSGFIIVIFHNHNYSRATRRCNFFFKESTFVPWQNRQYCTIYELCISRLWWMGKRKIDDISNNFSSLLSKTMNILPLMMILYEYSSSNGVLYAYSSSDVDIVWLFFL